MDDQHISLSGLSHTARKRLCRIAADMGRTPSDLACAVVSEWALTVFNNLADRPPASPERPDFERSGMVAKLPRSLNPEDFDP